jgi:outer membrane protein assembly factor BamB
MRACPLVLLALLAGGCVGTTVRRTDPPSRDYPAGITSLRWRTAVHQRGLFEPRPEECATGVVVEDRFIVGSRGGTVVALEIKEGQQLWSTPVSGGVDSAARYDSTTGNVYVGTDDGFLYALDAATGAIRWTYKGRGAIERLPELGGDAIHVASASDRIVALDPRTGELRWQYEREAPEGFTIHGHSGPRLHRGVVYLGFSDGYVVALNAGTGDPVWGRSLAAASEQYIDADATPAIYDEDTVITSSYSGGLYALSAATGDVLWRLNIEGAGTVQVIDGRLYFSAPREGLTATTGKGEILWRQGLADAGDLTPPVAVGPYLVFSGSRAGLFIVDRASGRLLELFNPGRGMCGAPVVDRDGHNLYVLANSGTVYAVAIR